MTVERRVKMKYAIFYTYNVDGTKDTFCIKNAKQRDKCIQNMLKSGYYKNIHYCPIYKTGKLGQNVYIRNRTDKKLKY